MRTVADVGEYMTLGEFASLRTAEQHAVWLAYSEQRVDAVLAAKGSPSGPRLYHRDQVQRLLREAGAARG